MITPELFIIFILTLLFVSGILRILNGALRAEKSTHYSFIDVLDGLFSVIFVVICILI